MASVETNDAVSPANDSGRSSLLTSLMAIVLLLESVLIVGWILKKADYGFDLSDESFYMIWIERPFEYPVSPFQFGSILSLPYKFLHYDLVSFRQFNILTTYMLAFVVAYQLLGPWLRRLDCTLVVRSAVSAAFALPSLTVMTYWLMTPSYNSLNGIAFLLVCVAIFSNAKTERLQMLAAVLIGCGGYLSFMAKPTSALVLGVVVLVFVWGVQRWCLKSFMVAICTAVSLVLISMFYRAGGPLSFVVELRETLAISKHPDYSFFRLIRWNSPHLDTRWRITFGFASLLLFALLSVVKRRGLVRFGALPVQLLGWLLLFFGAFGVLAPGLIFKRSLLDFLNIGAMSMAEKSGICFFRCSV